jgi:hypothetical protein
MITWTDAAYQLADDAREPGYGIAALVASAWRARVDPYATRSLVSAACVLAGPEVMRRLWDQADPCPGDEALLEAAEGIEAQVAGMLRYAAGMAADCASARDRAAADHREAAAAARIPADGGLPDPVAARVMQEARRAAADCEAALDILDAVRAQLKLALDSLRQVPAELADTYEAAYDLLRGGGSLPRSGHFLTGAA